MQETSIVSWKIHGQTDTKGRKETPIDGIVSRLLKRLESLQRRHLILVALEVAGQLVLMLV